MNNLAIFIAAIAQVFIVNIGDAHLKKVDMKIRNQTGVNKQC